MRVTRNPLLNMKTRLTAERALELMTERLVRHYARELEGIIQFEFTDEPTLDYHLVVGGGTSWSV